jgi:alcohol dehydrogenase
MARPAIPGILDLVAEGRLRPQLVTSATVSWDDAPEALLEPATKLVISRA